MWVDSKTCLLLKRQKKEKKNSGKHQSHFLMCCFVGDWVYWLGLLSVRLFLISLLQPSNISSCKMSRLMQMQFLLNPERISFTEELTTWIFFFSCSATLLNNPPCRARYVRLLLEINTLLQLPAVVPWPEKTGFFCKNTAKGPQYFLQHL